MEGDAGRDANKSFGYPPNAPLVEQVDTIALEAMLK